MIVYIKNILLPTNKSFLNISLLNISMLSSCLDYKKGFGGSFGIQKDRVDKSAHGWEHVENVDKHASQTGEILSKVQYLV